MHTFSIQKISRSAAWTVKISAFVAASVCLFSPSPTFAQNASDALTLRQKVGQIFIWTYPAGNNTTSAKASYEKYQPGALIAFGANIKSSEQIAKLNFELQALAAKKLKAPFFLMIDQEGGAVTRLHTQVPLPSALALGKMGDAKFIEGFAHAQAELLKGVGFNVNLAPVLDVSNPNRDSFIGNRAFGDDPEKVSVMAVAYAEGLNAGGIIPTAKHFPGHGGVQQDSHHTLAKKMDSAEDLADRDWVPFENYAESEFPRAVMMAHLALPNVDPSGVPATYSKIIIDKYLRGELHYDGLIMTDDLEMAGASIAVDIGERAVRAFLAGNDMLLVAGPPTHQRRAFEAVLQAVEHGRIPVARLEASVKRILNYKSSLHLGSVAYDENKVHSAIEEVDAQSRKVLKKNFELSLNGQNRSWPLNPSRTLVLSSDHRVFDSFHRNYKGNSSYFHLSPTSLAHAKSTMAKYDLLIFYASGIQTAHWLDGLDVETKAKTIVVNANSSGEVAKQSEFLSVLNINSSDPQCGAEIAKAFSEVEIRTPASLPSEPATN